MKKYILFTFMYIFHFGNINAQDSIKVQQNLKHFYYENLLENFHNQPFLFYIKPTANYTHTTLSYSNTQNNNAKQKQALEEKNIRLETEGVFKKKNTLFSGNIKYTRNSLNSLGWNISNLHPLKNEVELSPIYNLAYRRGDWQNQLYQINGNLILPIIKDKLFTTANVNYKTFQFFGKNQNPVSRLIYLDILSKASLFYKISSSNYLGITGEYGYVNNTISIFYLGGSPNVNLPINTEIYGRISYGYGVVETALYLVNEENDTKYGAGINYIYHKENQLLETEISYSNTKTLFNGIHIADEIPLARYTTDKITAKTNWYNFNTGHSFSMKGSYTYGENFRINTNGKNYEASLVNLDAKYQILKKTNNFINHNYGIFSKFCQLEKKDFQAVNSFDFANLSLGFFYGKDFHTGKDNNIFLKTKTGILLNLTKSKSFSKNNSRFYTDIAIPDFYLNTANKLNAEIEIGYQQKIKSATYLTIGTILQQQHFLNLHNSISQNGFNYSGMIYLNITY